MLTNRKQIIIDLDRICSDITRMSKYCKRCATTIGIESVHIFTRENISTRWDLDNIIPLCRKCHSWAHKNINNFHVYIQRIYGKNKWENLVLRSNKIAKFTIEDLNNIKLCLQKILIEKK